MSAPNVSDALASISGTIYSAASVACSSWAESSVKFRDRCVSFTASAVSPIGRAKIAAAAAEIPHSISDDPAKFAIAWGVGASVFAAGLAVAPRAAFALQMRNADRIRALIFGCASVTASGAAATASSLCVMQQHSNFTSVVRNAASPLTSNEVPFTWIWPSPPVVEVALLCGALSLLTFRISGGRARYLLPSDLCVRSIVGVFFRSG
jgi:hypothetical protein